MIFFGFYDNNKKIIAVLRFAGGEGVCQAIHTMKGITGVLEIF